MSKGLVPVFSLSPPIPLRPLFKNGILSLDIVLGIKASGGPEDTSRVCMSYAFHFHL